MQIYSKDFLDLYLDEMSRQIPYGSRRSRRRWASQDFDKANVVNSIEMSLNLAAASSTRGPTGAVWSDCPWTEFQNDPSKGMTFWDDFILTSSAIASNTGNMGGWSIYGSTGAQVNDAGVEGGVVKIGSDGDDESAVILSNTSTFRFVTTSTLALNQKMWYESRWARSSITTDIADHFAGLMKPTLSSGLPAVAQPITTTDDTLMTAGDFFGFHSNSNTATRGGPTEIAAAFVLTSGTINYPTNLTTLMASSSNSVLTAGGYVKTGWVFDPNAPFTRITTATARQTAGNIRKALLRFYINGLTTPAFLTSDDIANATATQAFPTAFMAPVFAVGNTSAGATNTLNIDWVRIAQKANS